MIKNNKKGIEMSINIIVMLVIGLTILGLVIGFVQGMFSDLDENIGGYQTEQDKQMLDRVKSCKDNPCVLPSPSVDVKVGNTKNLFIKVRSSTSAGVKVDPGVLTETITDGQSELAFKLVDSDGTAMVSGTDYKLTGPGFDVSQGGEDSKMYIFNSEKLPVGTYFGTLTLEEETGVGGSATITINIK
jgi:hypothetical protein